VRIRPAGRKISTTFETYEAAREWRDVTVGEVTGRTYVDKTLEQRAASHTGNNPIQSVPE
jgi:hypothetical protein